MKIVRTLKDINIVDFGCEEYYSLEENTYIKFYSTSLTIIKLENAMRVGKSVNRYSITGGEFKYTADYKFEIIDYLAKHNINFVDFIIGVFDENINDSEELTITKTEKKGVKVFSPFYKPKRINEPNKWTLSHIVKGILTGQITKGECRLKLTDDYAFDSNSNFGKGHIDMLNLCKDLVESPSGWWINKEKEPLHGLKTLGVNCCNYKYNLICFDPNGEIEIKMDEIHKYENVTDLFQYKRNKVS